VAYRLRPNESVRRGLRRLATKQLRAARDDLRGATPPRDEAIHEARKSVKKVRAILQLIEADEGTRLRGCRKRLRSVNRTLSGLRDADAMIEILSKLRSRNPHLFSEHTYARVRRQLSSHKRAAMEAAELDGAWTTLDDELRHLRRAAERWRPAHRGFSALSPGIELAHRRGRKAMARALARQTAPDFHEWRKLMKALWYALRLVDRSGGRVRRDVSLLHGAETWLGDDHNIVVLCAELSKDAAICGGPVQLDRLRLAANRYQGAVRKKAVTLVNRIYAQGSRKYVRGIERAWTRWRQGVGQDNARARRRTAA